MKTKLVLWIMWLMAQVAGTRYCSVLLDENERINGVLMTCNEGITNALTEAYCKRMELAQELKG